MNTNEKGRALIKYIIISVVAIIILISLIIFIIHLNAKEVANNVGKSEIIEIQNNVNNIVEDNETNIEDNANTAIMNEINNVDNSEESRIVLDNTENSVNSNINKLSTISAKVVQIVSDDLWIVKEDVYAETLIRITDNIMKDSDIRVGDTVNITYSGKNEEGYPYALFYTSNDKNYNKVAEFTFYNDDQEAEKKNARYMVKEVLGEKCWMAEDTQSLNEIRMFVIDCDYTKKGDLQKVGSKFTVDNGNVIYSSNHFLKDVVKIEKAK